MAEKIVYANWTRHPAEAWGFVTFDEAMQYAQRRRPKLGLSWRVETRKNGDYVIHNYGVSNGPLYFKGMTVEFQGPWGIGYDDDEVEQARKTDA